MTYQETLDYLFSQLPMYQRVGQAAYKTDLDNTLSLCKILGNPESKFKSVHVAGTNGKGSTSHMIASILQEAGYKVGLYTSPHLKDFRERIKINGRMISEDEVVAFVQEYSTAFGQINLSFFEWTVGLAFNYFAQEEVDIAVIETGLGGRLDSTNVISPELSLITNIGMDHMQFLGADLESIAHEKAGIIKKNTPVVIGENQPAIKHIFVNRAEELSAPISFAYELVVNDYECDLKGAYQKMNIRSAICGIDVLIKQGWTIEKSQILKGLSSVVKNTGLLGRWQVLQLNPMVICDTGHNKEGISIIVDQLSKLKFEKLHVVFGAVNDKVLDDVLALMPKNAHYYFCQANIARAMDVNDLFLKATKAGLKGEKINGVVNAIDCAKKRAKPNDVIFIGGSTFVVAEALL
jgi:dihydrofolate synthase/folylpolyglutamate synthase